MNRFEPEEEPNQEQTQLTTPETSTVQLDPFALEDDDLYLDERSKLLKRRDELGDIFDKGRVALASGAIALTVTISKDLVAAMALWQRVTLAFGWMVLAASLICAVLAVYRAGLAYDRQIDVLDDDRRAAFEDSQGAQRDRGNKHSGLVEKLNVGSLWLLAIGLFVSGTGLFSAFAAQSGAPKPEVPSVKIEVVSTGIPVEVKMSNKEIGKPAAGTSKEQKSFGPKDRPVTPKPTPAAPATTQTNQAEGQTGKK